MDEMIYSMGTALKVLQQKKWGGTEIKQDWEDADSFWSWVMGTSMYSKISE